MFFDFSSAFNTIRPSLLGNKLTEMQVDAPLVGWITDYLTSRPQHVRLMSCRSDNILSSTGAPQGTVLSPFLFTLYTSDFRYKSQSCHLQKFSDDSAIVGCIRDGQEVEYRSVVDSFVEWCERNHLQLNITKTKELIMDFRKQAPPPTPVTIRGADVEIVEDYRYLGVHLDCKLDWTKNTNAIFKKGQSRLFLLRRLRSFNVGRKMLTMFYHSVLESVVFFAVVCWGSGVKIADANRLNKLIRRAGSVLGVRLENLEEVSERRMLKKLLSIMDNPSHPMHAHMMDHRSTRSKRLIAPKCRTDRHRKSFVPVAIGLFNSSSPCR
uniref:Reverse transcriptase domain-containing protein n=1 Tax=Nothobranchius pienaari TaxID=704102 RepID=A0A1A8PFW7_9TELE